MPETSLTAGGLSSNRHGDGRLTADQVRQVGHLARLELSDNEISRLTSELNVLLAHFEKLEELDTGSTAPTFHVLELSNIMRDDEVFPGLPVEEVIANAPRSDGPFFVVPRIVDTA